MHFPAMTMSAALVALLCLPCVLAVPSMYTQIENVPNSVPTQWHKSAPAHPEDMLTIHVFLKVRNENELEKQFWEVSTPGNPNYGKFLSLDEIHRDFAPSSEDTEAVFSWALQYSEDCELARSGDILRCNIPVSQAEAMLQCKYFVYRTEHNTNGPASVIRSDGTYSMPAHIAQVVSFIGTAAPRFNSRAPMLSAALDKSNSVDSIVGVVPETLRKRYNITTVGGRADFNKQAVAQFLGQHYSPADLAEFMVLFGEGFAHHSSVEKKIGPDFPVPAGVEASLDIEYIMSTGANISTWFYSTAGKHEGQEPFLEWMYLVNNETEVPFVHSVSYGDDEDSLSITYMVRINQEFQKAGLRGISLLFASGDSGVGCNMNGTSFVPSFPASSPYVTAVGGTLLKSALDVHRGEDGNYISGGGFSNVFNRPSYQDSAVTSFLKNSNSSLPSPSFYNSNGRAYPDISALSNAFVVVVDLIPMPGVSGTSAACPTAAGIISVLNDVRLSRGMTPLGFLNTKLYSGAYTSGIYDVERGCNAGCTDHGFCAVPGWDPVTGFGTLNFGELMNLVLL